MSGGGVMLSGWLRKSPPEKKIKRYHSWKKRWFVLKSGRLTGDPNVLEYYKHQASRKPIKSINLNDCFQIDVNVPIKADKKDTEHQFVFGIVTNSRTFYLVADSLREMSSWVHCLCDLCGFNHDSSERSDLGFEFQTFKAGQQNCDTAHGTTNTPPLVNSDEAYEVPKPLPRPGNTLTASSKPLAHDDSNIVDTSASTGPRMAVNENGYDFPQEDDPFQENNTGTMNGSGRLILKQPDVLSSFIPPKLAIPSDDADSSGYLHLADCETVTENKSFLDVGRMDERRSSTDSVFTHEGAADESQDEAVNPVTNLLPSGIQSNSRFLLKVRQGRLSSMPDCPPPPPPTDVLPLRLKNFNRQGDDDDEDNVADARKRPLSKANTCNPHVGGQLPPIGDSDIYRVPPNLQCEHRVDEDGTPWSGDNSPAYDASSVEGGRFTGKLSQGSNPEYINTADKKCSDFDPGLFTCRSAPGPGHGGGRMLYDVPSPLSPVFPLNIQSTLEGNYQSPKSPGQSNTATKNCSDLSLRNLDQQPSRNATYVRKQLMGIPMLDVGNMTSPSQISNPSATTDYNVSYSAPIPFSKSSSQSIYSTPNDCPISIDVGSGISKESTYTVPPARPPKPLGAPKDTGTPGMGINPNSNTWLESVYSAPKTVGQSASIGCGRDVRNENNAMYDTVRQSSPMSPPLATVSKTQHEDRKRPNEPALYLGASKERNAISASNSPLATPDMGRRIQIEKNHSFSTMMSPLVQKTKLISGSAPSIYDVPQSLQYSPVALERKKVREFSQSSTASADSAGDNSSTQNHVSENSIYDAPRRLSDPVNRVLPKSVDMNALQKIDDVAHPSYEKMAAQHVSNMESEEPSTYTLMAGATTTSVSNFPTQVLQMPLPAARPVDNFGPNIPPPVHRDLKPGRRSLGSDGGSSQPAERRNNGSWDSYESDEAVSPPHTSIVRTMAIGNEPKSHLRYSSNSFSPMPSPQHSGSRINSITSPKHGESGRMDSFGDRLSVSPLPPQRPPKSSHSSSSPRSPPVASPGQQLLGRSYPPTPTADMIPQVFHERHFMAPSHAQGNVPERPPKPAKMKVHQSASSTQAGDDGRFSPPRRPPKSGDDGGFVPSRPPKPSMTPSSGDSLLSASSPHSGLFFPPSGSVFSGSSLVPPPTDLQIEREIKYIEIKDFPIQNENTVHLPLDERAAVNESVEYIQLDVDKTRALEKMKMERQNKLQERAHFDTYAFGKGKDKHK